MEDLVRIRGERQRDCPVLSAACSAGNPSHHAARSPNVEYRKQDRASSQATDWQSSPQDVTPRWPNRGDGLSWPWERQICFCRAAASARLCWIWQAWPRSLSPPSSSLPGFAFERQRNERNRAFFSSCSTRVPRAAPNYCSTSNHNFPSRINKIRSHDSVHLPAIFRGTCFCLTHSLRGRHRFTKNCKIISRAVF